MNPADPHPASAYLGQATAAEIAADLVLGRTTSVAVTHALLDRIAAVDGPGEINLRAVLALAPDALAVAEQLDAERATGRVRGPLHGVPVLVKDNIEAVGLPGSAGSLALADRTVGRDAPLVARLREAGLVVLGATNLSEWANIRSSRSTSGWSAVGGLTGNPWALDRSAGGSSSGSGAAVAGGLSPLAVGTETDGSITCPSSLNGCVGLKPTVGLLPTEGIVPISGSQDAPGPMSRTVHDAALLLDALAGTTRYGGVCGTVSLHETTLGAADAWLSGHPATDALFTETLATLRGRGTTVTNVDVTPPGAFGTDELVVLLAELQTDLDAYLAARPGDGPASLADVVAFNREHADAELAHYGQELFEQALTTGGRGAPEYAEARARNLEQVLGRCLEPAFSGADAPDLLIAPAYAPAWKSDLVNGDASIGGGLASAAPSIAGWPVLCIPMGLADGLPVGLVLIGQAYAEEKLLAIGHAVEEALGLRAAGVLMPAWRPAARG
ncbi:amidase family protein [Gaiella sp.]|uniref:amidase family protein n=1 Tax=Gaiella sp. TaxID=2663207 RepID=UPI0032643E2E